MTSTETHFFIVQCAHCKKEKSRQERTDLRHDLISHGMCVPICEEAKKNGWAKYVTKANGGEL